MNLHPQAVRLVLDQGHPVAVDVVSGSMTPTIEPGTRVRVEPIAEDLHPGDIVLILSSNEAELVLHRVIRLFAEGGQHFVIHQGDAQNSAFGTCLREAVLGRAVGFPLTPARALPTLEVLDPAALRRFQRRRRVSLLLPQPQNDVLVAGHRSCAGPPPSTHVPGTGQQGDRMTFRRLSTPRRWRINEKRSQPL